MPTTNYGINYQADPDPTCGETHYYGWTQTDTITTPGEVDDRSYHSQSPVGDTSTAADTLEVIHPGFDGVSTIPREPFAPVGSRLHDGSHGCRVPDRLLLS